MQSIKTVQLGLTIILIFACAAAITRAFRRDRVFGFVISTLASPMLGIIFAAALWGFQPWVSPPGKHFERTLNGLISLLGYRPAPWLVAYIIVGMLVSSVAFAWKKWNSDHDDTAFCRVCDYCLRGLAERRCPECGTPF